MHVNPEYKPPVDKSERVKNHSKIKRVCISDVFALLLIYFCGMLFCTVLIFMMILLISERMMPPLVYIYFGLCVVDMFATFFMLIWILMHKFWLPKPNPIQKRFNKYLISVFFLLAMHLLFLFYIYRMKEQEVFNRWLIEIFFCTVSAKVSFILSVSLIIWKKKIQEYIHWL